MSSLLEGFLILLQRRQYGQGPGSGHYMVGNDTAFLLLFLEKTRTMGLRDIFILKN